MADTLVDLKASLDPMTQSVLAHPNGYGLTGGLFWTISLGCGVGLSLTDNSAWLIGSTISGLIGAAVLGVMYVAVRRAKRLLASLPPLPTAQEAS